MQRVALVPQQLIYEGFEVIEENKNKTSEEIKESLDDFNPCLEDDKANKEDISNMEERKDSPPELLKDNFMDQMHKPNDISNT